MFLILLWCLKLLASILHMILHNEKKYLFALNPLYRARKYLFDNTSVSMPQIMLLKMLEKKAIMSYSTETIFR